MIDTLDKPGYICDRDVNDKVPEIACKTLGLNGGGAAKKMPRSIYGNPQSPGRPLFVLKRLRCSGGERSLFECEMGAWGDHDDCTDAGARFNRKSKVLREKNVISSFTLNISFPTKLPKCTRTGQDLRLVRLTQRVRPVQP